MPKDVQFSELVYAPPQIEHRYGDRIHLLSDPLALSELARLCSVAVVQPEVNRLARSLYEYLVHQVIATELPRVIAAVQTRMIEHTPAGVWHGPIIDRRSRAVVVAVARAGLLPSQIAYDVLNEALEPGNVRQDHTSLNRETDSSGRVVGAALGAAKIGGGVQDAFVFLPDPMGATGSTLSRVLRHYSEQVEGKPARVIALHLIVTPEYLRLVTAQHPEVEVYAFRLDRGLSSAEVLRTVPGERWDEERGLTDNHYIVPGGGGLGEVMNNSFV